MISLEDEIKDLVINLDPEKSLAEKKKIQLEDFLKNYSEEEISVLENKIYKGKDIENIIPKLIFVKSKEELKIFDYYRHTTSSFVQSNMPGKVLKVMVVDEKTNFFIGILQLSTDLSNHECKIKYLLGKEEANGKEKILLRNFGANISICVPMKPFGFNFCGGKLLAMLAFSKEIWDQYYHDFRIKLGYLLTMSINGKSIQYDRLKELKYIGNTLGFSSVHVSDELLEKIKFWIREKHPKFHLKDASNMKLLKFATEKLDLDDKLIFHGKSRGIYIGLYSPDAMSYLKKPLESYNPKLEEICSIYSRWLERYGKQRKNHLIKTNRFL